MHTNKTKCFKFHASDFMLNTKPVKYLQSRPYHIRMTIFLFSMFTLGMFMISIFVLSAGDVLTAEKDKTKNAKIAQNNFSQGINAMPTISGNLKKDLKDFSGMISGMYGSISSAVADLNKNKEADFMVQKRIIKPASLPVSKQ